jgi:hypothetical protein
VLRRWTIIAACVVAITPAATFGDDHTGRLGGERILVTNNNMTSNHSFYSHEWRLWSVRVDGSERVALPTLHLENDQPTLLWGISRNGSTIAFNDNWPPYGFTSYVRTEPVFGER